MHRFTATSNRTGGARTARRRSTCWRPARGIGGSAGIGAGAACGGLRQDYGTPSSAMGASVKRVPPTPARNADGRPDGSYSEKLLFVRLEHRRRLRRRAHPTFSTSRRHAAHAAAQTRRGTPPPTRGLAVTATNKDSILSLAAAGAAGGRRRRSACRGDVYVVNTDTSAYLGTRRAGEPGARATAGTQQSVFLAAGNDFYHLGVAGSIAAAGRGGRGRRRRTCRLISNTTRRLQSAPRRKWMRRRT